MTMIPTTRLSPRREQAEDVYGALETEIQRRTKNVQHLDAGELVELATAQSIIDRARREARQEEDGPKARLAELCLPVLERVLPLIEAQAMKSIAAQPAPPAPAPAVAIAMGAT
jgi:hypothetical protein